MISLLFAVIAGASYAVIRRLASRRPEHRPRAMLLLLPGERSSRMDPVLDGGQDPFVKRTRAELRKMLATADADAVVLEMARQNEEIREMVRVRPRPVATSLPGPGERYEKPEPTEMPGPPDRRLG